MHEGRIKVGGKEWRKEERKEGREEGRDGGKESDSVTPRSCQLPIFPQVRMELHAHCPIHAEILSFELEQIL